MTTGIQEVRAKVRNRVQETASFALVEKDLLTSSNFKL